jgi:hypothetical protein
MFINMLPEDLPLVAFLGARASCPPFCSKIKGLTAEDSACNERAGCPRSQDAIVNHLFSKQISPPRNPGRALADYGWGNFGCYCGCA